MQHTYIYITSYQTKAWLCCQLCRTGPCSSCLLFVGHACVHTYVPALHRCEIVCSHFREWAEIDWWLTVLLLYVLRCVCVCILSNNNVWRWTLEYGKLMCVLLTWDTWLLYTHLSSTSCSCMWWCGWCMWWCVWVVWCVWCMLWCRWCMWWCVLYVHKNYDCLDTGI